LLTFIGHKIVETGIAIHEDVGRDRRAVWLAGTKESRSVLSETISGRDTVVAALLETYSVRKEKYIKLGRTYRGRKDVRILQHNALKL